MYSMPYRPWVGINHVIAVKRWCYENIGEPTPMNSKIPYNFENGGLWYNTMDKMYFKEERHAMWYALRWL